MALGILCSVLANQGAVTMDGPVSHGSIRTENAPLVERRSVEGAVTSGEKMRRKVESALRCLTVTDMRSEIAGYDHGDWVREISS